MDNGVHRPMLDEYTLISDILSARLHGILIGTLEVEEGLAIAEREIRGVLDRGGKF